MLTQRTMDKKIGRIGALSRPNIWTILSKRCHETQMHIFAYDYMEAFKDNFGGGELQ